MMHNTVRIILLLLLFLSPQQSWASKLYRVAVFGDGITSGYQLQPQDAFPAKLQKRLHVAGYDRVEVYNLGKDDVTTAAATGLVDKVVAALPDVVIVQLGFNDAKRGVLPSATTTHLNTIIASLQRSGAYIILAGVPAPNGSAPSYEHDVSMAYYNVATARKVALLPNIIEGIANNPYMTLADGMHPNTVGVDVMVENIFPFVDTGLRWRWEIYKNTIDAIQLNNAPQLPPVVQ